MRFELNDSLTITSSNELILKNTSVPFDLSSRSDGIILPIGTTFERPQLPFLGMMRFNSSLSQPEVYTFYGWTTLDTDYSTLIDISPRSLPHSNDIATITGRDFVPGMLFEFVGSTGISHIVPSWSLMSSSIVQATRPSVMPPSEEPYTLRVTMPSGVQYELPDIVEVGDYPIILTPAAGSLGTFSSGCNITPITFTASDSDGSNIVSMTKTSDLSQLSFAYNNSNVATLTGITTQILQATSTYNFTLDAMDSGSNVASRNYSITVLYTPLAITSVVPANLSQNLLTNSYSTSYTFSANKTGVVWSLSPTSAYASINTSTGVMSVAFNQGVVTFGSFTVTASWGIDSTSQSWTYNMYSYDTSVYPTNAWAILDVTMLSSQANNSTVEQWGVQRAFKQPTVANRPIYVSTGGYKNGPYVFFNRTNSTFLDAGSQTLPISTNGGFTIMCLLKFTGTAGASERIIDFGSGAPIDNILFSRSGTSANMVITLHNSTTGYGLTTTNTPVIVDEWCVYAARWIKGSKLQIYKNNVLQLESSFTTVLTDKTVTNTYIGKSFWADAFLNAHISKHFTYDRALSDNEMSLIYAKMINAPAITLRPANITTQNTSSALYSIAYAFTGVASAGTLAWTLNTTTYGNINASTGALTLTFPIYTTASGTFIVTATDSNGSSTYSWTYAMNNIPLFTSSQPSGITQSTGSVSYSTSYTFTANQTVTWSLNTTTYGSINSSTGALTLTFPLYTTASGTFIVTATNQAGFTSTQSWSYGITNIPTITSTQPTKITQSTNTSAYETSYTFTANQAVTWSINTTTYGTINSSTGVLALVFPTPTDTKGTFTVSATNASGFAITQSWDYDITSATFYTQSGKVLRRQSGSISDSTRAGFDNAFNNTNGTLTYQTNFSLPGSDNFSMEYTAWFVVPVTGTYSFGLTSDDGSDLAFYVNSGWQVIANDYGFHGPAGTPTNPGSITLTAGVLNPIRVRFHEGSYGEALNVFMYVGPLSTAVWSTVPISYFRVPLDASPTVSTITANGFPSPAVQPVSITSAQPANLTGSTFSAANTTSYTFTSGAAVTWSITPTTYGDIHPTNGQLTLTFPQETTASGTFVVTATYLNNSVTQTWTYNISASLQVVYSGTASPGSSIQSSFNIFTFSVPAFHKCDSLIYNVTYTKPSNSYGLDNLNYRLFDTVTSTFVNNNSTLATGSGMPPSGGTRSLSVTLTNPVFTLVPDRVYALRIDWWSSYAFFSSINTSFVMNYKPYDLAPIITSTQPENINENINVAPYTTSYSFTGTVTSGSIVWSLTPTTYGNIDSSTGDLTLTFPQGVTSSGTFVVTASAYNGATATRSWTYATTTPPLVITSTQPTTISQSTVSALYSVSYTFAGTASAGSIAWSITPTTYGNIDSTTGALTLTFPQGTAASGTFIVTATDSNGSTTQSWTYAVSDGLNDGAIDSLSLSPKPVAAYALRRLFASYSGPQIRVRRSTDSLQTNAYFDAKGNVINIVGDGGSDWSTWSVNNILYIMTFYDQSEGSKNMTQSDTSLQPILVISTTDRSHIRFQNKILAGPNVFASTTISDMHLFAVSRENVGSPNYFINLNGNNQANPGRFSLHAPWSDNRTWFWDSGEVSNGVRANSAANVTSVGDKTIVSAYKSTVENKNGFRLNQGTRYLSTSLGSAGVTGGIRIGEGASDHSLYEVIIFSAYQPVATETQIEQNIQAFNSGSRVAITSTQPTTISQSTASALYTVSYTFAGTASAGTIAWSLTPTTYGNINSSTGALTLTFPQGTAASGTFIVTATDSNGYTTQSWTYNVTGIVLKRYPPVALNVGSTTSTATTLSSQTYGNGLYTVTATSQYSAEETPGRVFDLVDVWPGWTTAGRYNGSTGVYTGSASTTVSGTARAGEWIQIDLPYAIVPRTLTLTEIGSRNVTSLVIAGSTDGSTWTSVYANTGLTSTSADRTQSFEVTTSNAYKFYRCIALSINPANQWGLMTWYEFSIYSPTSSALVPVITSTQPTAISQSTGSALYTVSYTFAGTASAGSIVWSLTPTTYGNINSSTGALTLTFPQGTAASGTFIVTATDTYGSVTQSWGYAVTTTIPSNYTIYVDHNTSSSYFINDVSTLPTFDLANQRIVFNRSSKYLDVGSRTFSMLTNGWTHLIKLNLTAQSNGVDRIFDSGAENNNYISFLLTSTNALRFLVRNSTNTALCDITTTQTLALNTTYVLAARTTSSMASIWINGVKVKEVSCIPTDRTNNNSRIGIDPYLSSAQLSAYVYKVYVYNYALSDTDIGYFT